MIKWMTVLAVSFWGVVTIGVALWLSRHNCLGGALACTGFSASYFVFAWRVWSDQG